ncbi:hypothetical protein K474DRAFT_1730143 [Panus rudis PR-1116 ss-1]|nr:hypothetical protein K474DRAFT_1730143 [Panus rudis PR-1116 ss-1]
MPASFATIPEELVERILSYVLAPAPSPASRKPDSPHPTWHPKSSSNDPPSPAAALLVCKTWLRIGTPLYYHAVSLASSTQTRALATLLRTQPQLRPLVRDLTVDGLWANLGDLVSALGPHVSLQRLDILLDGSATYDAIRSFCEALTRIGDVRHIVLRKNANAYLTQPGIALLFETLSRAIAKWTSLSMGCPDDASILQESIDMSFRFSPIINNGPEASHTSKFISALAHAPNLKEVRTELPSVWNTALLEISESASLRQITVYAASPTSASFPLTSFPRSCSLPHLTSLYMREAKKHARLMELIRAGTPASSSSDENSVFAGTTLRGRAWTMGTGATAPTSFRSMEKQKQKASPGPSRARNSEVAWPIVEEDTVEEHVPEPKRHGKGRAMSRVSRRLTLSVV